MIKIEIFDSHNVGKLETEVNNWLKEKTNIKILTTNYVMNNTMASISILYEEINKPVETTNEQLTKEEFQRLRYILSHTNRGYLPIIESTELDGRIYDKLHKLIV